MAIKLDSTEEDTKLDKFVDLGYTKAIKLL